MKNDRKFDHLPLHVKPVAGSVNYDAVLALPQCARGKDNLTRVLRWVRDRSFYDRITLPAFRRYHPRFSTDDLTKLRQANKFTFSRPRCGVKAFCVPEWSKERRRPIFWPDLNESIPKDMLMKGIIPLRDEVRQKVSDSRWSVQFDFASWYDQLPLAADISPLFSVNGTTCLSSLPMGFRPSAEVAQIVSAAITDFPLPKGVNVIVYIDNVRFGGSNKEGVREAAKTFVKRCKTVGAILNEYSIEPVQQEDFLGEHYDLVKQTRTLTTKTLEKAALAKDLIKENNMTYRQLAAVFGLLFFCSDVLRADISSFFVALRAFRRRMSEVSKWDSLASPLCAKETSNLQEWLRIVTTNAPTPIWTDRSHEPDITIYCDASSYGWGAVSTSKTGVQQASGQWSDSDRSKHDTQHSSRAEPLAVQRAALALVSTGFKKVQIFSDHQGLIYAGNARYGKSEAYNDMCRFLKKCFPQTLFEFKFVPGVENTIADGLSRGLSHPSKELQAVNQIQEPSLPF